MNSGRSLSQEMTGVRRVGPPPASERLHELDGEEQVLGSTLGQWVLRETLISGVIRKDPYAMWFSAITAKDVLPLIDDECLRSP